MSELLETLKNDIDFLFVQENPIFLVRNVPSTASELGDELVGPVTHREWQVVVKPSPTQPLVPHPSSQVAIYVNRRILLNFQIFPDFDSSIDLNVLPITLRHNLLSSVSFTLINVYNRPGSRNSAIFSLLPRLRQYSDLALIQGDFNLHSGIWDPTRVHTPPISERLFTSLSDIGFGLANNEGLPTFSNRRGAESVIDLVFIHDSLSDLSPDTFIDMEGRGRSDHALITLVFGETTSHWGHRYIPSGEDEEDSFIKDLSTAIIAHSNLPPDSAAEKIRGSILASWDKNSKTPRVGAGRVSWWTSECQNTKDAFLADRS